jgi:D-sedoheptulose 7-phosphate isomerase
MGIADFAAAYLSELRTTLADISGDQLARVVAVLEQARRDDSVVYLVGNGGSASLASHFASDLCRCAAGTSSPGLRAISLADNVAALTAMANDTSYDDAIAEMLSLQLRAADVLFAISGSGGSPNLLRAVEIARKRRAVTVGLVGFGGGELARVVDHALCVDVRHYGVVEDAHLAICHILAMYLAGPERMGQPGERPRSSLPAIGGAR